MFYLHANNIAVQDTIVCITSTTPYINTYIATSIDDIKNSTKKLIKITDFFEVKSKNQPIFYIFMIERYRKE